MIGFLGVDHVGIAVAPGELERQVETYKKLGFVEEHREEIGGTDQVREVFLRLPESETAVQLLEPLSAESPISKLLARNGGRSGFAHMAYRVLDIHRAFEWMKLNGFALIDAAPRPGSRGSTIFFVHPKSAGLGYLLEVVQIRTLQKELPR
jgi:methylmalonyl-CoA/ethylmalonyl-CoA epimerase